MKRGCKGEAGEMPALLLEEGFNLGSGGDGGGVRGGAGVEVEYGSA